jgi:hypothetical protein
MGKLQLKPLPKGILLAGVGVILIAILTLGAWLFEKPHVQAQTANTQPKNLFALIAQLNGTTSQMLANTEGLHQQVQQVQGKLGELSAQELILQKQMQTGKDLAQALSTQEQLTGQGVALMGQILDREKQSVMITDHVSQQADQLAQHVSQNADTLQQLAGPLNTSAAESEVLNGQMDQLLAELSKSQDTFRLFGTLDDLLHNPLDLPGTISKIENSVLPAAVKDGLLKLLPGLPGTSGGSTNPGSTGGSSSGSTSSDGTSSDSGSGGGLLGGGGGILGGILH